MALIWPIHSIWYLGLICAIIKLPNSQIPEVRIRTSSQTSYLRKFKTTTYPPTDWQCIAMVKPKATSVAKKDWGQSTQICFAMCEYFEYYPSEIKMRQYEKMFNENIMRTQWYDENKTWKRIDSIRSKCWSRQDYASGWPIACWALSLPPS